MEKEQAQWIAFVVLLVFILTAGISLSIYHLFAEEKAPLSAISVRSNFDPRTVYILPVEREYY